MKPGVIRVTSRGGKILSSPLISFKIAENKLQSEKKKAKEEVNTLNNHRRVKEKRNGNNLNIYPATYWISLPRI